MPIRIDPLFERTKSQVNLAEIRKKISVLKKATEYADVRIALVFSGMFLLHNMEDGKAGLRRKLEPLEDIDGRWILSSLV